MESLRFVVLILCWTYCQSLKLEDQVERQQNATLGETTILTCTFSDFEIIKPIQWFKDPNIKPINDINNSRYNVIDEEIKNGTITSEFTIDEVKHNDKGSYECNGIGKTNNEISKGKPHDQAQCH